MTQNPFEALGAGGFDMNALLQQAQQDGRQRQPTSESCHGNDLLGFHRTRARRPTMYFPARLA